MAQSANGAEEGAVDGAGELKPGLAFDEEAKLVYGIVFSLRNLVNKLAGRYAPCPPALSLAAWTPS